MARQGYCNMPSIYDRIRLPDKAGKKAHQRRRTGVLVACRDKLASSFELDAL